MPFQSYDELSSYFDRLTMTIYGKPGVGKTHALLDVAERGESVFMLSSDMGFRDARNRRDKLKKTLNILPLIKEDDDRKKDDYSIRDEMMKEIRTLRIRLTKAIDRGIPASRIWVAVDTITKLVTLLLDETRKIALTGSGTTKSSRVIRDTTTRVDYQILSVWVSELQGALFALPANIVFVGTERVDDTTGEATLNLPGSAKDTIMQSCDIITRMMFDQDTHERKLFMALEEGMGHARVRGGGVETVEPADLIALRNKLIQ